MMSGPVRLAVQIAGTGHAVPQKSVASRDHDRALGLEDGHLERLTGVNSRFVCDGESQIDLAVAAARAALQMAGLRAQDIDLVLGASAVPYQPIPATAPLVMGRLGCGPGLAAAFDVNATCLGFIAAVELAAMRIQLGQSRIALVFSSEIASRALPWDDQPDVAALFGDGAAAVVLSAATSPDQGIRASLMRSFPDDYDACQIGAGGTRIDFHRAPDDFARNAVFRMDGKALFRLTHRYFPAFVEDLLQAAGWGLTDVDLVVPHQASPVALQHMIDHTGFAADKVVNIAATYGNQIAASIPTALDVAVRQGRVGPGSRVVLLGTSAGVSFGGLAIVI